MHRCCWQYSGYFEFSEHSCLKIQETSQIEIMWESALYLNNNDFTKWGSSYSTYLFFSKNRTIRVGPQCEYVYSLIDFAMWFLLWIIVGIWFYFKPFSTIIILVDLMTIQKWTRSIQRPNDFDVSKNQLAAHYCYWYSSTTMVRSPLMYHLISKWPRDLLHKWNEIISKYLGIL